MDFFEGKAAESAPPEFEELMKAEATVSELIAEMGRAQSAGDRASLAPLLERMEDAQRRTKLALDAWLSVVRSEVESN